MRDAIKRRYPKNRVTAGRLAVTVSYADKTELQILPAIRTTDGFRIAELRKPYKWSNVIHPERFDDRLIKVNNACGGRVVPTIKLAKAMADCFIRDSSRKISGYHMESLAVDAFAGYEGELDPKSMLAHFLGHSIKAVMTPIRDPSGQTSHVDGYLGQAMSKPRKVASTQFGQIRRNVNTCKTRGEFDELFCQ